MYILTAGRGAIRVVPEIPSVAGIVVPVSYTTNTSQNHDTVRTSGSDGNVDSFSHAKLVEWIVTDAKSAVSAIFRYRIHQPAVRRASTVFLSVSDVRKGGASSKTTGSL